MTSRHFSSLYGALYRPPGANYFACRQCHRTTYKSSQDAHRGSRVFAQMGFDAETRLLLTGRIFSRAMSIVGQVIMPLTFHYSPYLSRRVAKFALSRARSFPDTFRPAA